MVFSDPAYKIGWKRTEDIYATISIKKDTEFQETIINQMKSIY